MLNITNQDSENLVTFVVCRATFEEALEKILKKYGEFPNIAMLVFADPFGYKGELDTFSSFSLMFTLVERIVYYSDVKLF